MGRVMLLLFGLLLAPWIARASDTPGSANKFDQGLLWKVSMPGKPANFIFGTLHVNADSVLALPPEVEHAFAQSTTLVTEVVLDEADKGALQLAMIASRPELPAQLGADWPKVDGLLALRGLPARLRAHLQPWAALVVLLKPEQQAGKDVLDVMLQRRARLAGKAVVGLESIGEQVGAISGLPRDAQIALLREAVSSFDRLESDTAAMLRFYLAGDMARAWGAQLENRSSIPAVRAQQEALSEALITRRNIIFAKRAMPLLKEGGTFVAVGALHLVGESGLPALLEAEGLKIERVE
jgi:uncharacterized protein YbaP (TraB family)